MFKLSKKTGKSLHKGSPACLNYQKRLEKSLHKGSIASLNCERRRENFILKGSPVCLHCERRLENCMHKGSTAGLNCKTDLKILHMQVVKQVKIMKEDHTIRLFYNHNPFNLDSSDQWIQL